MKQPVGQPSLWTLHHLLPAIDESIIMPALAEVEATTKAIEAGQIWLTPAITASEFSQILTDYETLNKQLARLIGYASLWFTVETQSPVALSFKGQIDDIVLEANNRTLFFTLWWKHVDDMTAARLLPAAGDLTYYLQQLRNFQPYTLSEAEEKVINLKNVNGIDAMMTLYEMITGKLTFTLTVEGKTNQLTREELFSYVYSSDPTVRQAAYDEFYRIIQVEGPVLAQIYNYRVRDWANESVKLRGFASPIAVRNLGNNLPDAVVDTLLRVVQEESHIFQAYFRLKAKVLGLPKLRRYDLYAPLNPTRRKVLYDEAVEMTLAAFADFSPAIADIAQRVFTDEHIDAEPRPGKQSGAFCAGILPELSPYVLLNYTGELRDVATLAHELGHAVHAMLAGHHSVLTFQAPLPLAEVASVFGELMLTERLLEAETGLSSRLNLLVAMLDDAYGTVMRQAYFVLFEQEAHAMILAGKSLPDINTRYLADLRAQFGDAVEVPDMFQWEWTAIPHFYQVPFYCYAYSFGQLMTLALYQQYRVEKEAFVPKYLKILSYGGAAAPMDILGEAGIDVTSADFWRGGFRVIAGFVQQVEALLEETLAAGA